MDPIYHRGNGIMKMMLIQFGYGDHWAVSHKDALTLLDIFARSKKVKQEGYSGPYYAVEDQSPPIDGASIADVVEKAAEADTPVVTAPKEPF